MVDKKKLKRLNDICREGESYMANMSETDKILYIHSQMIEDSMDRQVIQVGNSFGILIPMYIARKYGLHTGKSVRVTFHEKVDLEEREVKDVKDKKDVHMLLEEQAIIIDDLNERLLKMEELIKKGWSVE